MANEYLDQLKRLSAEERSDNIGQIATVLAIKEVTDVLERVVRSQDRQDKKLGEISETLHQIDKRVTRVEDTEVMSTINVLETKVDRLDNELAIWKTRLYTISGTLVVAWAILGDTVSHWIGLVR